MACVCCLAGIDRELDSMFGTILKAAGATGAVTSLRLDVAELGKFAPDLLVCDIDEIDVDPLELLRRIRFVLPDCTIAVYTGAQEAAWARACHLAGANCLLSKRSEAGHLAEGVRDALGSGCYTDPLFTAMQAKLAPSAAAAR